MYIQLNSYPIHWQATRTDPTQQYGSSNLFNEIHSNVSSAKVMNLGVPIVLLSGGLVRYQRAVGTKSRSRSPRSSHRRRRGGRRHSGQRRRSKSKSSSDSRQSQRHRRRGRTRPRQGRSPRERRGRSSSSSKDSRPRKQAEQSKSRSCSEHQKRSGRSRSGGSPAAHAAPARLSRPQERTPSAPPCKISVRVLITKADQSHPIPRVGGDCL